MKIEVKINGQKLLNALEKFPKQTFKSVNLEIKKGSRDIQLLARSQHRFTTRTGALERSVETRYTPSKLQSRVGINRRFAKYGKYIHDGFKSWRPDPFIHNAGQQLKDEIQTNINRAISRAVRGAF